MRMVSTLESPGGKGETSGDILSGCGNDRPQDRFLHIYRIDVGGEILAVY